MKDAIQHVEPDSAVTVDTGEEIFTAKEVAQDIEASRSWVYAHADELGGYRVGRRLWFRWQRTQEEMGTRRTQANTKIGAGQTKTRAFSAGTRRQACRRVPASLALPTGRNPFP
jgi:hypothetical protein